MRRLSLFFGAGLLIAAVCSAADSLTFITQTGFPTGAGFADGPMPHARFNNPRSIAFGPDGSAYVADSSNDLIRRIRKDGWVETAAGGRSVAGSTDGPGDKALFSLPNGVTVDESGNAYIADLSNQMIRKLTPSGMVSTLAGTAKSPGSADGNGAAARFKGPRALVFAGGAIYVTDSENHTIRRVTLDGQVTTLAGAAGVAGSADGTGAAARFNYPAAIATDGRGTLFVADTANHTIRRVTLDGSVTTIAGAAGSLGSTNGPAAAARFAYPADLAVSSAGALFVTESSRQSIRKIENGMVSVYAGDMTASGSADGLAGNARFNSPGGLAFDSAGNLWVADMRNHTLRRIDASANVLTVSGRASAAIDGPLALAEFLDPRTIARDPSGTLYVGDGNALRRIASGSVTTVAGDPAVPGNKPGTGSAAAFYLVQGIAVDGSGNVLMVTNNDRVWRVTPAGVTTVVAGTGTRGSADGPGSTAMFNLPSGIAVDRAGNIFVSELGNAVIRRIDTSGRVSTFAGSPGSRAFDDGIGSAARFNTLGQMAIDREDNLYVADGGRVRKITPAAVVSTVSGPIGLTSVAISETGTIYVTLRNCVFALKADGTPELLAGDPGDYVAAPIGGFANGPGSEARFDRPLGLVAHGTTVCVVDAGNNAIRTGVSSTSKRRSVGR